MDIGGSIPDRFIPVSLYSTKNGSVKAIVIWTKLLILEQSDFLG